MKLFLVSIWLAATLASAACATRPTGSGAPIVGSAALDFPPYDEVDGLDDYATRDTYRTAVNDRRFKMERLSYPSDGLQVLAYVYRPAAEPTTRLPVVIFNRGSWVRPAFHAELLPLAHRLAQAGFLVVAPMYRGSGGAAGRDEMGGAELDDLFNLLPVLRAQPFVDMDRLYLYGESRGAMMTYQALRDGFPAQAAAVYGGFTNLGALLEDPKWTATAAAIWPDFDARRDQIIQRRSAVLWAEKIDTPILIMHGGRDDAIDLDQPLALVRLLHEKDKPFELVVMEGEGHVLTGRAAERDALAVAWFKRHGAPGVENGEHE